MLTQLAGALARAFLVVLLVAMPSLILPSVATDTSQIVMIIAFLAGVLIFLEYFGRYPSILEFRFAPPYNRLKFGFAALTVLSLSLVARGAQDPTSLSQLLAFAGESIGRALDFPYSPVRSVLNMLPVGTDPESVNAVRIAAGLSYTLSMALILVFVLAVKCLGWPVRNGTFNVCVNLPLFDPTGGGDVVRRLSRDASINISLGFLLPFLIPVAALALSDFVERFGFLNAQNLIWMTCIWAFLPASMIMRGIAMTRIAELITQKRRRAHAKAQDEEGLQTV